MFLYSLLKIGVLASFKLKRSDAVNETSQEILFRWVFHLDVGHFHTEGICVTRVAHVGVHVVWWRVVDTRVLQAEADVITFEDAASVDSIVEVHAVHAVLVVGNLHGLIDACSTDVVGHFSATFISATNFIVLLLIFVTIEPAKQTLFDGRLQILRIFSSLVLWFLRFDSAAE